MIPAHRFSGKGGPPAFRQGGTVFSPASAGTHGNFLNAVLSRSVQFRTIRTDSMNLLSPDLPQGNEAMSNNASEPKTRTADDNPYAPPQAPIGGAGSAEVPSDLVEAEAIRRTFLSHEASVKSIGSLHDLGAGLGVLGLGIILSRYLFRLRQIAARNLSSLFAGLVVNFLVFVFINLVLGIGLTGLKPLARWTEVTLATILLLICLLATVGFAAQANDPTAGPTIAGCLVMSLILSYILYLLLSKKSSMVFSPEYRLIIEHTPHIRYRTSWIVKGCLIVLVVIGIGIVAGFFPPGAERGH
jgi:hypothetical protein